LAYRGLVSLNAIVDIDYSRVERYLRDFLVHELEESERRGFVLGLSGGVDSSTAYALAVRSFGRDRVMALIMPDSNVTPKVDVDDALSLVGIYGSRYNVIDIAPIVDVYKGTLPLYESDDLDRVPLGNLRARIRMSILYYYANKLDYMVLGTGDRSEYLIGYFTKYGDGAVDIAPLIALYKSQVRRFALHLGVPERIAFKPSSPRLWPGHMAEAELGVSYEDVDLILYSYIDLGVDKSEIHGVTGIPEHVISRVIELYERSHHKRAGVKIPDITPIRELMIKL